MGFRRNTAAVLASDGTRGRRLGSVQRILWAVMLSTGAVLYTPSPSAAAPPCPTTLNVVAHQDDDLLFINPDISDDIAAGRCVVTLFATAGDAGKPRTYWRGREAGAMAAYAAMARVPNRWVQDTIMVAGQPLARVSLVGIRIALIFMRLPDGHGYAVTNYESLHGLFQGSLATIHAIDASASYTRDSLTDTLTGVMDAVRPGIIRTLDYVGRYLDGDHGDHHSAAYFTLAAHKNFQTPHRMYAYLGYRAVRRPVNLTNRVRDAKLGFFLAYAPHDSHVCRVRSVCLANAYGPRFSHRYSTGNEVGGGQNLALVAQVSASSDDAGAGKQAAKAVDNSMVGSPVHSGDEWATRGGRVGSWITLGWSSPRLLNTVVLYDRPNSKDQVTAGTLQFSDGSTIKLGALPNDGSAQIVRFAPRSVTSVRLRVTGVSPTTKDVGLAELQAFAAPAS